jgi:acyl carrier protein
MSDVSTIQERVIQHLVEASDAEIEASKVTAETNLRDDLDLSSLQAVTLVMDLEDEFDITVEDEEIEGLATVGDIFDLITSKTSPAESA